MRGGGSRTCPSSLCFEAGVFAAWPLPLCSPQDMKDEEMSDAPGQEPRAGTMGAMAIAADAAGSVFSAARPRPLLESQQAAGKGSK